MINRFRSLDSRNERRLARIARWDRPIEGWTGRLRAYANMLFLDHGIFRLVYLNLHEVAPGFWRSAQPTPGQLARFARAGGRSVVYLRGGREHGSWQLEKEACARLGLTLREFVVRSRGAPERETALAAEAFFASLEKPALIHCKSGADRAGFVATLYKIVVEGAPADEALKQLSLRYGHFRYAKTGILDLFFERYRDEGETRGIAFGDWVANHYDPEALERDFHAGLFSELLVDRIMRRE
ncbi:MAG: protein tyrosine phosphatase [Salinarimonadaceae bacterium]|nr:MAG: protein tyrosine phosphatase [Salinarimonadaceae bacterium]